MSLLCGVRWQLLHACTELGLTLSGLRKLSARMGTFGARMATYGLLREWPWSDNKRQAPFLAPGTRKHVTQHPKTCYQAQAKMSTARKHFTKHQKKDIAKHTRTCSQAPENMLAWRYFSGPGPGPGSGPRLGAGDREPEAGAKAGASSEWRPFSTNCQFLFVCSREAPASPDPQEKLYVCLFFFVCLFRGGSRLPELSGKIVCLCV